jgi:hypothetical protein
MTKIRGLFLAILFLYCTPIWATAPSIVQVKTAGVSCDSSGCSLTFDSTPTVGNFAIGVVSCIRQTAGFTPALTSLEDNKSNSYNVDVTNGQNHSTEAYIVGAGSTKITSSSATFTVTFKTDNLVFGDAVIIEVANLATSSWFDATTSGFSGSSGTLSITRGGANSTANALVIGALAHFFVGTVTTTNPSGYTQLFIDTGGTNAGGQSAYKIVTASETSAVTWSSMTAGDNVGSIIVYKGIDAGSALASRRSFGNPRTGTRQAR